MLPGSDALTAGTTVWVHLPSNPEVDGLAGTIVGAADDSGCLPVIVVQPDPLLLHPEHLSPLSILDEAAANSGSDSDSSDDNGDPDVDVANEAFRTFPILKVPSDVGLLFCLADNLAACEPRFCAHAVLSSQQQAHTCGHDNLWAILESVHATWRAGSTGGRAAAVTAGRVPGKWWPPGTAVMAPARASAFVMPHLIGPFSTVPRLMAAVGIGKCSR